MLDVRCFSTTGSLRRSKNFKRTRCAGLFQGLVVQRLSSIERGMDNNFFFTISASCNYWRWGPGGVQENINAICVLALNMINDKVIQWCRWGGWNFVILLMILNMLATMVILVSMMPWWYGQYCKSILLNTNIQYNIHYNPYITILIFFAMIPKPKVFLVLWWWFFLISVIGVVRLISRSKHVQS